MNDHDLRDAFRTALDDPPASRVDVDLVIETGSRRQRRRRRTVLAAGGALAVAGAVLTTALISGGPGSSPGPGPATTGPVRPDEPDVLGVTCSEAGIRVSATEVAAQPAGVVLKVVSSLPKGSYLGYESAGSGGPSGGDEMVAEQPGWTMAFRPGAVTFRCLRAGGMDQVGAAGTVVVRDPGGFWRGGLDDQTELTCRGSGLLDWAFGFVDGAESARAAAQQVAEDFSGRPGTFTVRPLDVGYVDDPQQTWLMERNGKPYASVLVREEAEGRFSAAPDASCKAAETP